MKNYDKWVSDLIDALETNGLINDDCTRAWVDSNRPVTTGEKTTLEAWVDFLSRATDHYVTSPDTPNDQGDIYVFPDGSCFATWKESIDQFYRCVYDIRADDSDVDEWFLANIDAED